MDHPFDADTAVEAVADHRYRATIVDRWNARGGRPNGGYLLAVCLQALRRSMHSPIRWSSPRSFFAPPRSGPRR